VAKQRERADTSDLESTINTGPNAKESQSSQVGVLETANAACRHGRSSLLLSNAVVGTIVKGF
jgi:hypothetical protein